jgi:hypothetical protein
MPTRIGKSARERFMRAVEDELSKFEHKELAFRQAERDERAAKLGLPIARNRAPNSKRPAEPARACGKRDADVQPDNWNKEPLR